MPAGSSTSPASLLILYFHKLHYYLQILKSMKQSLTQASLSRAIWHGKNLQYCPSDQDFGMISETYLLIDLEK